MEQYLTTLQQFLHECEPITNLMIVDYFTTNSWETRMPQDWREAFESPQGKLSSLDLMELVSLGKLREYKSSSTATQGEHDASGPQDWPESLKDFLRMIKALSINRTLDPDCKWIENGVQLLWDGTIFHETDVFFFFFDEHKKKPSYKPDSKFKDTLDIHLIPGMSPKKLHEVEILSGLMASYSKQHGIGSVIDLGAGQGYLSRVLAFQHQLCVLGVDSNTIQTCGAQTTQKRTEKLFVNKTRNKQNSAKKKAQKQAKAKDNKDSKDMSKSKGQEQQQLQPTEDQTSTSSSSSVPQETSSTACPGSEPTLILPSCPTSVSEPPTSPHPEQPTSRPGEDESCKKISKKFKTETGSSASGSDSGQSAPNKKPNNNSRKKKTKKNTAAAAKSSTSTIPTATTTSSVAPATPVESTGNGISNSDPVTKEAVETQRGTKAPMDSSNDPQMAQTPGSNFQLQHITHTITAATLPTLLKEHFPKISKPTTAQHVGDHHGEEEHDVGRWTLCGLHACGDLTSNMVKLFLESSATCLFSVGCCYHWITERYDRDGQVVLNDGSHGFPLSSVFNARKAHLGDHAKMIACQSPERWLPYQKESEDAIHGHYFRALLHVSPFFPHLIPMLRTWLIYNLLHYNISSFLLNRNSWSRKDYTQALQ